MKDRIILVYPRNNLVYTGEVDNSEASVDPNNRFCVRGEGDQVSTHTLDWLVDYVDKLELIDWNEELRG